MVLDPAPVCRGSGLPNDTMTPLAKTQREPAREAERP